MSDWIIACWRAVVLVVHPPQLKPTIIVTMLPMTTPQTPGLSHVVFSDGIRHLLALRRMFAYNQV
jgi:hypothetical protein